MKSTLRRLICFFFLGTFLSLQELYNPNKTYKYFGLFSASLTLVEINTWSEYSIYFAVNLGLDVCIFVMS